MKKSQLIGQVFIYILAVIITAFILGYGYKAIVSFREKSEQASYIKFKTELQNAVKTITSDFGSVKIIELSLPANFKKVCFVKSYPSLPALSGTKYPIIEDSVNSGVERNAFLVENIAKDSFYAGKIDVSPDLYCIDAVNGLIKLRLEGKGDHTLIRSAS